MLGLKEYLHIASAIVVLAAVGFLSYVLIQFGEERVSKKDFDDFRKQVASNALIANRWHDEQVNATANAAKSVGDLRDAVSKQPPIIVRVNPSAAGGAAGSAPASGCTAAVPGGAPAGHGEAVPGAAGSTRDLRPLLNGFELKYGQALADCRVLWDSWPH